jgi:hypothetical protein
VNGWRTAEPEPAAARDYAPAGDYAPREDPAPERSPAPRSRPMEYSSQDYSSGQDHRVMDRRSGPADSAVVPSDRPARGSLADLQLRLERLPSGHPSSPYDDQGQPKPALQQLRQLELPLADEERESESSARASRLSAAVGEPNGAASRPLQASRPLPAAAASRPDWTTSQNGAPLPAPSPTRDEPARRNGVISHGSSQYDDGTSQYDYVPAADEPPARNGRTAPAEPFSNGWRDRDEPATGQNGHSAGHAGTGDLTASGLPGGPAAQDDYPPKSRGSDQYSVLDDGAPEHSVPEHSVPEHGLPEHGLPEHGLPEHGLPEHSLPEHSLPEHQPGAEAILDRGLAEHGALTREQEELADQALGRYRSADGRNVFGGYGESGLTPAIRRVEAHLPNGRLAPDTDLHTLKSPERYKDKLARLIARNPGVPARDLAAEIYDAARYTFVFEPEDYTDGTWLVHRRLKAHGFELEARRNRWESPEYKGIRTRWRDPAHDLAFEVQFHTPLSWDVVQRTHEAYLRITHPDTPPAERAQLRARQVAAAATTRAPPRCAEIGDFRADVR